MDDGRLPKRVMFGTISDGVKKGRGGQEKEWVACVESFQDPTKLETRSPRCPELDRYSHRVEEGGKRVVQIPPGEENRQITREPSIYERDRVGWTI